MIAFIKGIVAEVAEDSIVLENQGMGYHIFTTQSVLHEVYTGMEIKLYTYLNVREDAMQLYGFLTKDDLNLFKLLITVSGIGPKGGLSVLGVMTGSELRYAVLSGDSKAISKAPGVGAKTAQKVILELKDKLKLEDMLPAENTLTQTEHKNHTEVINETVMALTALGYSGTDAMRAVRSCEITEATTVEELLKKALKKMI